MDVEVLQPLNVRYFKHTDGLSITMLIFVCKPLSFEITLSDEHDAYEWVELGNAKEKIADFFHGDVDACVCFFHNLF